MYSSDLQYTHKVKNKILLILMKKKNISKAFKQYEGQRDF